MFLTKQDILAAALRQSAADCCCSAADFSRESNVVVEAKTPEGGSRYMEFPQVCALFTYGRNIVASCRKDLMPDVEAYLSALKKNHYAFETPGIYDLNRILEKAGARVQWMHTCCLPDPGKIYGADLYCAYETRLLWQESFAELYIPEWSNALCSDRKELDVLGVGAYDGEKLIALAACSADCPEMWQIGIDVLPEYRGHGIATVLTNQLARAIFESGKIPFYAFAWANMRSIKNAVRSGFEPAWSVITAKCADR